MATALGCEAFNNVLEGSRGNSNKNGDGANKD
jgi:hypothetical protein